MVDKRTWNNMSGIQDILLEESHAPPLQHVYTNAGSGTETIPGPSPVTYSTVIIELWGPSGAGGPGTGIDGSQGGGGASGSYCKSSYSVSGSAGKTMSYTIGTPGVNSTISSGTFTISIMTSPYGNFGSAPVSGSGGIGGIGGGVATGGNVINSNGNAGENGDTNGVRGGLGGPAIVGQYASGYSGSNGTYGPTDIPGRNGVISFTYLQ